MARLSGSPGRAWSAVDLATRWWWRLWGRSIDPYGDERWLAGPHQDRGGTGDDWLEDFAGQGLVRPADAGDGLLPDPGLLAGPEFDPAALHPSVADFYRHAASYRMDVWSQWSRLAAPVGAAITLLFGRRLRQLALPVEPLAVSRGLTSTIRIVDDPDTARPGAAWLRTLVSDGSTVFSGFYRVGQVPGSDQPHVWVTFPLEQGNLQVFLRPELGEDGSLWLVSRSHQFGDDGAYVTVRFGDRWWAANLAIHERFHVYVDEVGTLRTDHTLKVLGLAALRLHYRLVPDPRPSIT